MNSLFVFNENMSTFTARIQVTRFLRQEKPLQSFNINVKYSE